MPDNNQGKQNRMKRCLRVIIAEKCYWVRVRVRVRVRVADLFVFLFGGILHGQAKKVFNLVGVILGNRIHIGTNTVLAGSSIEYDSANIYYAGGFCLIVDFDFMPVGFHYPICLRLGTLV